MLGLDMVPLPPAYSYKAVKVEHFFSPFLCPRVVTFKKWSINRYHGRAKRFTEKSRIFVEYEQNVCFVTKMNCSKMSQEGPLVMFGPEVVTFIWPGEQAGR